jgi:hypothetical protein
MRAITMGDVSEIARAHAVACDISTGYSDLLWGDRFTVDEIDAMIEVPGIKMTTHDRCLVVEWIREELRYYAGPKDPTANEDSTREVGTFASITQALQFAEAFFSGTSFTAILVPRLVRYRMRD